MYMKQAYGQAAEAVGSLYFFLLSDAYREFREAEVRWECYATSQYHFDDGVTFVLEAVKPQLPVDHPVWTMYSEKVAEVGARVAQADARKVEKQAVLKGIHQGFVRFCRAKALDAAKIAGPDTEFPQHLMDTLGETSVAADGQTADDTYRLLDQEWEKHSGG
jgi:hypothetical protein